MVERDLDQRLKSCGVKFDTLMLGVNCGAYPSIEAALDRLDKEVPIGGLPEGCSSISRMILVNQEIDRALFRLARATSAWTWLEDFEMAFVLMGYQLRGMVLHKRLTRPVPFRLLLHRRQESVRFLRFYGDAMDERTNERGKQIVSPLRHLARKLRMTIVDVRELLEALIRTCDDGGWHHTQFPFLHQTRTLDEPHRLMKQHRLLIHSPFIRPVL